uniref:Pentatricopeptide repeat protein n=1 Tax=Salvia miltiorrhiza TaxID=226208 RepID=A0A678WCS9_SALMI|nr:pentatricopeptide repeat protein [Salvia miltiorrhiza]
MSSVRPVAQTTHPEPEKLALLIDQSKNIKHLKQIHALLLRRGLESYPVLNLKLQRSYSSLGYVQNSVALFNLTQNPDVFFYTAIIRGHAINGLHERALNFYVQMLIEEIEPNAFTLSTVLKACCTLETGKALHCHAHKFGLVSDSYVRTALIDIYARGGDIVLARRLFDSMVERNLVTFTSMITGYAKNGNVDEARELFDGMEERDVVSWNVMIDGYAQHGRPNEAIVLFRQMMKAKLKPDEATMVAVLSACGQVGALGSGQWIHSYLGYRATFNCRVGTALIDMYSKCASLEDARKVFDGIKDKDAVVYNAMIGGYAIHGFSQDAMKLFKEMPEVGLHPTDITFISVLSACAHAGLISESWGLFNAMKDEYGIQPKVEHYGCMVNLLGRAGRLEEAYELVKSMSIGADSVLWGALLNACRLHKNIALGEKVVQFLLQRGLAHSGTYVLLSNIYAAAGNWDGVARTRAMMKQSGVQKEPGCSSVEVNNKVHEFLAGDTKHPKSKDIYAMLEEMSKWLKAHRHASQTEEVLHNMDDEAEKERSLKVHSEKLALAFALISTKRGTTIKIVKNLRVCPDCHAVMKLVSKITGRKIVMRDRNRFHHCVDGMCSCGDYW